jgi:hypothetical protein
MIEARATKIVADSLSGLLGSEFALRLHNGTLGVDPMRFNGVEPGTLDWEQAGQNAYPTLALGRSVMFFDPGLDPLTLVPGGVIPHQQQSLLPLTLQFLADPLKEGDAHLTYGTAIHKPQPYTPGVGTQQPIASQGYRVRVLLLTVFLYQVQRFFRLSPTMEGW